MLTARSGIACCKCSSTSIRSRASKYSIVQPVAALPLYVLGKLVGQPLRLVARFNLCVFSLMLLVVYRRLSARTETSVLRHWCLLMLACSMYLYHLRMFFTEVLSAAAVVVGLTCLVTDAPLAGSFALCLAVINSPTLLPALALVALKLAWDKRKPWYLVLPAVSVLAILLDAWIRRGSPLSTGYETELSFKTIMPYSGSPGFTYPFVLGVLSCLFSFGKGLLFFAPGLFLLPATIEEEPLRRLVRPVVVVCRRDGGPLREMVRMGRRLVLGPAIFSSCVCAGVAGDRAVSAGTQRFRVEELPRPLRACAVRVGGNRRRGVRTRRPLRNRHGEQLRAGGSHGTCRSSARCGTRSSSIGISRRAI